MRIPTFRQFPVLVILVGLTLIPTLCFTPSASAQSTNTITITSSGGQTVHPGDNITFSYQAGVSDPNSISDTIAVSGVSFQVSVKCPTGGSETFTLTGPPASIDVPANSSAWYPASPVTGRGTAPSKLCGGQAGISNGLTLTTTDTLTCHANSAQGCCHTMCVNEPNPKSHACKPAKSCASGQKGGCCKT
jgi:hypothetical protein